MENFVNFQRNGVAIECGAISHSFEADWFVKNLDWRNLKIQANPVEIGLLRTAAHGSFTSHTCLSLDTSASHTHIQTSTNYPNGTLTAVPCFPLYSIMKAFNATTLDLLILNDIKLPLRILETLPTHDLVNINVISFVERDKKNGGICCSESTRGLMRKWGFTSASSCPSKNDVCYFTCSKWVCSPTLGNFKGLS
uniref:Protein Star n=1 Tax=Lygus hesperus TaxID=30085 RepID=A0A146LRR8_LYGHE